MPVSRTLIAGSPYVGVYLRVIDRLAILPPSAPAAFGEEVARLFGVKVVRTTVTDSEIVGALLAMNSHGAVVGDALAESERATLSRELPVTVIPTRHNALGNNVLANDFGAVVHPEMSAGVTEKISKALGVPAHPVTIAGLGTVGMAGAATNRGVVVHPKTTEREAETIARALQAPVHRSTANFGVPIVGACVAANSRSLLVGRATTPVEIVHLQEGFGIFD